MRTAMYMLVVLVGVTYAQDPAPAADASSSSPLPTLQPPQQPPPPPLQQTQPSHTTPTAPKFFGPGIGAPEAQVDPTQIALARQVLILDPTARVRVDRFGTIIVTDSFGRELTQYEEHFPPTLAQETALEQFEIMQDRLREQRERQQETILGNQRQTNEQFLRLLRNNPSLLQNLLQNGGGAEAIAAAGGIGAGAA
ncbi:hypothetical protein Pcinc_044223 [Petrolisthes cinctipes]|uniref:Uncharacterized protein n=1 Tax=Petrolisthes cinctipes TaxID=88211 RepID=A0AAE1BHI9_PETCI|nr:hypothetical protein Pcinc_044223 [Petrolisthes cinctipes]